MNLTKAQYIALNCIEEVLDYRKDDPEFAERADYEAAYTALEQYLQIADPEGHYHPSNEED